MSDEQVCGRFYAVDRRRVLAAEAKRKALKVMGIRQLRKISMRRFAATV